MTVIAPLGVKGPRAPLEFPGATNEATFQSYVEDVLEPALHERDVVVFDNQAGHLKPAVAEAIARDGGRVLLLPPYSPDYAPIKETFSKLKGFLRRIAARTRGNLFEAIDEEPGQATAQDILRWFQQAG